MGVTSSNDLVEKVLAVGFAAVVLAGLFTGASGVIKTDASAEEALSIADGSDTFEYDNVTSLQTQQTLGTELEFDGSGGLEGSVDGSVSGNWTLCTWAQPHATGSNMTLLTIDGARTIQYLGNQSTPKWVGRVWDAGERESYDVAVNATETGTRTHLCLQQTGQNLSIRANGTQSPVVTTTGTYTLTDARYNLSSWDGTIDETRDYNVSLDSADRAEIRTYPSRPLPDISPRVRVMYDARSGPVTSMPMYFTSGAAAVDSATLVSGVGGDTLTAGSDYRITNPPLSTPRLEVLDGGNLDGAPVVFVSYDTRALILQGDFLQAWYLLQRVIVFLALGVLAAAGYFAKRMASGDFP